MSALSVAVIGGGPAGMLAAGYCAKNGFETVLFERNEKVGKKLYITGKGRCNITNSADVEEMLENIPRNARFMYSALYGFSSADTVAFLRDRGVETKTERGGRIFPASDKSSDVIRAFASFIKEAGVEVRLGARVTSVKHEDGGFELAVNGRTLRFDRLVLATGGMSYPLTGSSGDGYAFARAMGHSVTELKPSLIPLETVQEWPRRLQGLSLKNVALTACDARGKRTFGEIGEMLFTHFGVTGPLVLSASSTLADRPEGATLSIDMKPGLNHEELDRRMLRDLEANTRRAFVNALDALLPRMLIPVAVELSGIDPMTPANSVTRQMRQSFGALIKDMKLTVKGTLPIDQAIITRGGVSIKEIDPGTMESKLIPGLYFAGEMIDVDGYTGGFNLQIACSTGALAGRSIE